MNQPFDIMDDALFNQSSLNTNRMPLSKEEYAQKMKETRAELFEKVNVQIMKVVESGGNYLQYLKLQATLGYTVTNTLLIMNQNPEATLLKDAARWKQDGHYINKGEKGIHILMPGGEYQKRDGTKGINYNPKFVFDISQVNIGKDTQYQPKEYSPELLVNGIVYQASIRPEVVAPTSDMPSSVYYDSNSNRLYVKQGLSKDELIHGLIREYSIIECQNNLGTVEQTSFKANSIAYMLCLKYGVMNSSTHLVNDVSKLFYGQDYLTVKRELESIKKSFDTIDKRMEHGIYVKQQNMNHRDVR